MYSLSSSGPFINFTSLSSSTSHKKNETEAYFTTKLKLISLQNSSIFHYKTRSYTYFKTYSRTYSKTNFKTYYKTYSNMLLNIIQNIF